MASSLGRKRSKKGHGHGSRNHRHASGNGLVRYYYGLYQHELRRKARKTEMFSSIREAFDSLIHRVKG